jgi:hypothetical protein
MECSRAMSVGHVFVEARSSEDTVVVGGWLSMHPQKQLSVNHEKNGEALFTSHRSRAQESAASSGMAV